MFVIVKSSLETDVARRGLALARDLSSDIVLMQNAVYLVRGREWEGLGGKVYALDEDLKLRGIAPPAGVQAIGYGELVGLMGDADKVLGMF